jgi:hypothetical protein
MSYFSPTTEIELAKLMGRPISGKTGSADRGAAPRVPGLGSLRAGGGRGRGRAGGGGNQTALLNTVNRTAKRTPEVMVKVTGTQGSASHTGSNMVYIAREDREDEHKFELEDERGEKLQGIENMYDRAREWEAFAMSGDDRRKGAVSRSITFSMPSGTDPEKLKEAVRALVKDEFAGHRYVMAVHTDTDSPHVHFTYATRNSDTQRRHYPKREDLQRYREKFAAELRERGIDANATSRKARLADRPTESIKARKMREAGKPIDKNGRAPIAEATRNGVLAIYAQAIEDLHKNGSPEAREAASSLARFVADKAVTRDADAARAEQPPKATERSEAGHRPSSTNPTDGTSAAEGAAGEARPDSKASGQDDKQLRELQEMLGGLRNERELREMLAKVRGDRQTDRGERDQKPDRPATGKPTEPRSDDKTLNEMRERLREMRQDKDRGR